MDELMDTARAIANAAGRVTRMHIDDGPAANGTVPEDGALIFITYQGKPYSIMVVPEEES